MLLPASNRTVELEMNRLATLIAFSSMGLCASALAAEPFEVTSTTFKDGTLMPKKVSNSQANRKSPNCVGENVSPQLSWKNAPEGTKSFAITVTDPEGNGGLGVVHWVAYGIPAATTSFSEGDTTQDSAKFVGGKSTMEVGHYSGPCTPPGAPHHYTFVVIATDLEPGALPAGLTLTELRDKLTGHTKNAAGIIGLFRNPY
jgi:Raf kinase inhibitor-like YbhB/YbcL family protein